MLQGCRLFKQCQNLPAGHRAAGLQAVTMVSEPTCRALSCRGAGCLNDFGTYLLGTVLQGCRLLKWCLHLPACLALNCRVAGCLSCVGTYLPGIVLQGCGLFKRCRNLPATLFCKGAGCLSGVGTYLPGTVLQV